jgi:Protein of unknown function (DUF1214)
MDRVMTSERVLFKVAAENYGQGLGWPSYLDVLAPHVEALPDLPANFKEPQVRQEFNRTLLSMASQAYFGLMYQDNRYPDFWPVYNQAYPFGFANPDDAYYMTVVDDRGEYLISGNRGSVRMLDFQICSNYMMCYGIGATSAKQLSPPTCNYNADTDLVTDENGNFEVLLSPEKPANHTGNWWKLESGSVFILVRQRAYDWLAEEDARLAIERVDVPAIRPRASAEELEQRLAMLPMWMENWSRLYLDFGKGVRDQGWVNKMGSNVQPGGVNLQQYIMGLFELADDEALILETEIPETCKYWMFHLTDELLNSIDPLHCQTSLNGHQAQLDSDGKFRAVISRVDPGVPNWLDSMGYAVGGIVGRWMYASSYPVPEIKKVKAADVRHFLPQDTPEVSTAQRDVMIRRRRRGAQMRRRW